MLLLIYNVQPSPERVGILASRTRRSLRELDLKASLKVKVRFSDKGFFIVN